MRADLPRLAFTLTIGLGVLGANSRAAAQPRDPKGPEGERAQAPLSPSAAPASSSPPAPARSPQAAPGSAPPAPADSSPSTPASSSPPAPGSAPLAPTARPLASNSRVPPPPYRPYIFRPIAPAPEEYWYGWQTLIIHGVAATSVLLALPATSGQAAPALVPIAIGTATFGGPIVHWAHGKVGTGFASLGLTLGLTLGGALFGGSVGAIMEMVSDGRGRDSGLGFLIGAIMGAPFGAAGAFAIDLSVLSFTEVEPPSRPRPPPVSMLPLVRIDGERTVMGLAGTF